MPSQPSSYRQTASQAFSPAEWELLTHLPARVMIAATSAEADRVRRTVSEGMAGLDAIAAGRSSDSDLVRAVVAAIYSAADDEQPAAQEFTDRSAGIADVLDRCRSAAGVLGGRADPADAAAYRHWLETIAARVCRASRSGGVLGVGGTMISPTEQYFLADLNNALRGQPR